MTTASLRLALVGAPNTGKTSLFNRLTGSTQKVANYPGVTVERKSGGFVTPEGRVDTGAMRPIMRGGYFDYFTVESENRFELRRPKGG